MGDLENLSQTEIQTTEKIQELLKILSDKKCRNPKGKNLSIFSKKDHYHLPSSQKNVRIIDTCKMTKKHPFYIRYFARQELKEIYKELSDGQEKNQVKDMLSKTGVYNCLMKKIGL
ncbi:hypothetical protein KAI04_00320 [Candidatus Pacearchaeota archaeon]|nr:hypothetical protein [Candidatus Pacearchaeota archaeon]